MDFSSRIDADLARERAGSALIDWPAVDAADAKRTAREAAARPAGDHLAARTFDVATARAAYVAALAQLAAANAYRSGGLVKVGAGRTVDFVWSDFSAASAAAGRANLRRVAMGNLNRARAACRRAEAAERAAFAAAPVLFALAA